MQHEKSYIGREQILLSFMDEVVDMLYPNLFDKLNRIRDLLIQISQQADVRMLKTIMDKLSLELEEMYRREKLVLFPYLKNQLSLQDASSIQTSGIHLVNIQFKRVLSEHKALKQQLFLHILENKDCPALNDLSHLVHLFESDCVLMQHHKMNHLFIPFGYEYDLTW